MRVKSIILISIVVLITLISTQNMQEITVNLLFWDVSIPLIFLIFGSAIPGFVIGFLYAKIHHARNKKKKVATAAE